jgi:ATP-binding protein involved in chromosome partitioning
MDIRTNSDGGTPVTASNPEGPHALIYKQIANELLSKLESVSGERPQIVFE